MDDYDAFDCVVERSAPVQAAAADGLKGPTFEAFGVRKYDNLGA
jgi:hypothetical protein